MKKFKGYFSQNIYGVAIIEAETIDEATEIINSDIMHNPDIDIEWDFNKENWGLPYFNNMEEIDG